MAFGSASCANGFTVLGSVVQFDFAAGALLCGIDDAGIEGPGINVNTDGALVEFSRIENAMDRRQRVDGTGVRGIHLYGFSGLDGAFAGSNILMNDMVVLDHQTADGDGHPAVLVAVVVDGTGVTDLPANGDELVKRSFVDQIASIVLAIPCEIRHE